MSDKIVVMSEGKVQQIGTPEDIYNEPNNAFVADFIGESNIFSGIMTGQMKVRFCGAEFTCVDDVPEGTLIDAVVRPEDVIITTPEKGIVQGKVTSVIFKGVHYEITALSGKNEIVIQTTKSANVGDMVGLFIEPDGIHIMKAEDNINKFEASITKDYQVEFLEGDLPCDVTEAFPGSTINSQGVLVDSNGNEIDIEKVRVIISIKPDEITMSDDEEQGVVRGHIINLIYKGDHYSYVIRTDKEEDFIVDDEYLWNMGDYVSLIIPKESVNLSLKK
jgi:spermidine/putrescine transport system ATP-binding protein